MKAYFCTGITYTAQEMKIFFKDFFSKCDQIFSFLWIWSHLLKNYLMENFIFCAVNKNTLCFRYYLLKVFCFAGAFDESNLFARRHLMIAARFKL